MQRVFLIVLDSLGVGALPDAASSEDAGAHTLDHLIAAAGPLRLPHLSELGLGNIEGVRGLAPVARPAGGFGRMAERSPGKDTSTGHWEMMGLELDAPFPTFPEGFSADLLGALAARAEIAGVLGNQAASGTEIIERLGAQHVASGEPIVYTSADSVLQIAAHEEHFGLERLFAVCEVARELTRPLGLGRVIARPFVDSPDGAPTRYVRTYNRRDWSLEPFGPTSLDRLQAAGVPTVGVGKISDIFAGRGLAESYHTCGDRDGMRRVLGLAETRTRGLIFVNLVDFDMLHGHRRDPRGYARNLEAFDGELAGLRAALRAGDLLLISADHGNDPTWVGSDHTREYVPLLAWGPQIAGPVDLGTRSTFADVGATVEQALGLVPSGPGRSFLGELSA